MKGEAVSNTMTEDAQALHEQYVTYVNALSGTQERLSAVWAEHSYARAWRGAGGGPSHGDTRTLLMHRAPPAPAPDDEMELDVETVEPSPRPPPDLEADEPEEPDSLIEEGDDESDWEEKLVALCPSGAHRRLVCAALDLVRSLRATKLATFPGGSGSRVQARAHARRLRRLLAPLWAWGGAAQHRPAAWLHAALSAYLPPALRHHYNQMLAELRRLIPAKLADRLLAPHMPDSSPTSLPKPLPLAQAVEQRRPVLVWLGCGRAKQDARWFGRVASLTPAHYIPSPSVSACSVEAWCSRVASEARARLSSLTSTGECSGSNGVVLAGCGGGAALAALAAGSGWCAEESVRGVALLAPPLHTAEGVRDSPDDALHDLRVPALLVVPQNGMQCTVGAAEEVRAQWAIGEIESRVLVVGGADDALRVSVRTLYSARLSQQVVDAAICDELAAWCARLSAPPSTTAEQDAAPLTDADTLINVCDEPSTTNPLPVSDMDDDSPIDDDEDDEDYEEEERPKTGTWRRGSGARSQCVVARGTGGTPLALPPPRRPPTTPLAPADIMHLPIVFADDDRSPPPVSTPAPSTPITRSEMSTGPTPGISVRRRDLKYTKVILAKRAGGSAPGGVRPIIVRGGVKLLLPTSTSGPNK